MNVDLNSRELYILVASLKGTADGNRVRTTPSERHEILKLRDKLEEAAVSLATAARKAARR